MFITFITPATSSLVTVIFRLLGELPMADPVGSKFHTRDSSFITQQSMIPLDLDYIFESFLRFNRKT